MAAYWHVFDTKDGFLAEPTQGRPELVSCSMGARVPAAGPRSLQNVKIFASGNQAPVIILEITAMPTEEHRDPPLAANVHLLQEQLLGHAHSGMTRCPSRAAFWHDIRIRDQLLDPDSLKNAGTAAFFSTLARAATSRTAVGPRPLKIMKMPVSSSKHCSAFRNPWRAVHLCLFGKRRSASLPQHRCPYYHLRGSALHQRRAIGSGAVVKRCP